MPAPAPTEHQEQCALVAWLRIRFPGLVVMAIPNGSHLAGDGRRKAMQMARLKAEGLLPGAPDLFIPAWRLFIEMKRAKGGRTSDEQAAVHAELRAAGYTVLIAAGWDEAREAVLLMRPAA